jgi:hypothetical protein
MYWPGSAGMGTVLLTKRAASEIGILLTPTTSFSRLSMLAQVGMLTVVQTFPKLIILGRRLALVGR